MIYREVPEVSLVELFYVVAEEDLEGGVELAVGRRRYPLRHGTLEHCSSIETLLSTSFKTCESMKQLSLGYS